MKFYITLSLIFLFPIAILSQDDYYITENSVEFGLELINGNDYENSRYCRVKKGKEVEKLTPNEITEYGLTDGRIYVSRKVEINDSVQNVFLEKLAEGKINLYYIKTKTDKIFFIEKDSSELKKLPTFPDKKNRKGFNSSVAEYTSDSKKFAKSTQLLSYNKKALQKFISLYNESNYRPFPHFRWGIKAGYFTMQRSYSPIVQYDFIKELDVGNNKSIVLGLFIEQPIRYSSFSIYSELTISRNYYSEYKGDEFEDLDFLAEVTTLTLPIQVKYTLPFEKLRPYIHSGVNLAYNLINDNTIYKARKIDNEIQINKYTIKNSDLKFGYTLGGGVEVKLNYKHSLFLEVRYSKLDGFLDQYSISNNSFQFFTGLNF